jgi:hypothetical protein
MSVDVQEQAGAPTEPGGKGAKSRRGRKPGQQPKERKELPASMLEMYQPEPTERVKLKRRRVDLSEQQQALVDSCQGVYQDWLDADQPTHWVDMPVVVWPIDKEFEEDALFMLRKSVGLINRKLVLGNVETFVNEEDGREWVNIPYCVIARPPKKSADSAE